jgi:hypothetical protein
MKIINLKKVSISKMKRKKKRKWNGYTIDERKNFFEVFSEFNRYYYKRTNDLKVRKELLNKILNNRYKGRVYEERVDFKEVSKKLKIINQMYDRNLRKKMTFRLWLKQIERSLEGEETYIINAKQEEKIESYIDKCIETIKAKRDFRIYQMFFGEMILIPDKVWNAKLEILNELKKKKININVIMKDLIQKLVSKIKTTKNKEKMVLLGKLEKAKEIKRFLETEIID